MKNYFFHNEWATPRPLRHLITEIRSLDYVLIFQTDHFNCQVHHLHFKFVYYTLIFSTHTTGKLVNLRTFIPRSVISCQVLVHIGPQLAVIDVTYPAACSHIAWAVQMSGFWLSSNQLPHWVSNFAKPTEPSQQSHTEKISCRSDVTSGWELVSAPAPKREGLPCHRERGAELCCLSKY